MLRHSLIAQTQAASSPMRSVKLQRACACGAHSGGGECASCREKRERSLQRAAVSSGPAAAPPIVQDVLRSPGQPLDAATRAFMEPRFGHDFSRVPATAPQHAADHLTIGPADDPFEREAERAAERVLRAPAQTTIGGYDFSGVRVHTGAQAAESAWAVGALAYTVGRDIVFGAGEYTPETTAGRRLLAHELAHVVQQGNTEVCESVQRVAEGNENPGESCAIPPPLPSLELWSGNSTLNDIRSEAVGDNRVLVRRGQQGEAVQLIQQALLAWGCEQLNRDLLPQFGADADFGGETEDAVRTFQDTMEIAQDGLVGPITLSRLDAFVAFGTIPEFPSVECKVIPPDVPASVIQSLADLGFTQSSDVEATAAPAGEQAVSAGIAGIPILCQVRGAGPGRKVPPAGICNGVPQHVVSIGNATFALCDFVNGSRMTAGVIPRPSPGNQAGFVEMRALGIALFGTVGQSLPRQGPGSSETDWQHGFIQTVRSLKYTATYQRGWSSTAEVTSARRDATRSTVPAPWYSNQSIPNFQFQVGNQIITLSGPIALGPEFIGTDPVGILDDPRVIFVETVPIDREPVCPCSFLESIQAKGELDTWLVVTPNGKGQAEADLAFLKHANIRFDLKADKASSFTEVQGSPTMALENGRGSNAPVLTGSLANDDLNPPKMAEGAPCPVTIPGVKCPVESPKTPRQR